VKAHSTAASSVLGMRFGQDGASLLGHTFDWQADLAWEHRYGASNTTLDASFQNTPGATYQINGNKMDHDALRAMLG